MRFTRYILLSFAFAVTMFLSACSGEKPPEKAIIGTWVQETPISMTANGIQTTTADTILKIDKNGEVLLTRNLDIAGQGLPDGGSKVSLELRGTWEILEGQLKQTQDAALIMPRTTDDTTKALAEQLQAQADKSPPTIKDIVAVDKKQLILQDTNTGVTDVYRRK